MKHASAGCEWVALPEFAQRKHLKYQVLFSGAWRKSLLDKIVVKNGLVSVQFKRPAPYVPLDPHASEQHRPVTGRTGFKISEGSSRVQPSSALEGARSGCR